MKRPMINLSLLWLLTSSCSSAPSGVRTYDAPADRVREAVLDSLSGYGNVKEIEGMIESGWGPEIRAGQMGWILSGGYRYRVRHRVTLEGGAVAVHSTVERRAPGGPRSLRWARVDGAGAAEDLLGEIARRLESRP